jgi:hypothetical protein
MDTYTPKFISRVIDYNTREMVTHEDYNMLFNLLIEAADYNTEALHAIINDEETALVINADHADHATLADLALNSNALAGAVLSNSGSTLASNDGLIPTSKQVKNYVDSAVNTINGTTTSINNSLNNTISKNTEQDGRLTTLEQINNQYGTRIFGVEGRATVLEGQVSAIQQDNIDQDESIAAHNIRITNLELQEVPENVVDTLMLKANFAKLVEPGVYSETTVNLADKATNLMVGATPVAGTGFVQTAPFNTAIAETVSRRGALADAAGASYTVAELKALAPGVYSVSAANAVKLGLPNTAGLLTKLSADVDVQLRFSESDSAAVAFAQFLYIVGSTLDATLVNTLTWFDTASVMSAIATSISTLQADSLVVSDIDAGDDISVDKTGNNCVINYTGPKVVISATQPAADPERTILWIQG